MCQTIYSVNNFFPKMQPPHCEASMHDEDQACDLQLTSRKIQES